MTENGLAMLIPAYNAAAFLPRLFRSAENQTVPFDEIWVYDDCSNDDTVEVARSFGIPVVRGHVNLGCSHGKNILASRTSCKWLHFHDADDELLRGFVEKARSWMMRDAHDVILFGYEERDERGKTKNTRRFDHNALSTDAISYVIKEGIPPFCGLYRRSAFLDAGGYDTDPQVLFNEDHAFHIRLAMGGLRFAADDDVMIVYHRSKRSMSFSNPLKGIIAEYYVMQKAARTQRGLQYRSEISAKLWDIATRAVIHHRDLKTAGDAAVLAINLVGASSPTHSQVLAHLLRRLFLRIVGAIARRLRGL
jgi:glycosyltransferase involved in cell wall biosynthesis